jgi:hypothetical protein
MLPPTRSAILIWISIIFGCSPAFPLQLWQVNSYLRGLNAVQLILSTEYPPCPQKLLLQLRANSLSEKILSSPKLLSRTIFLKREWSLFRPTDSLAPKYYQIYFTKFMNTDQKYSTFFDRFCRLESSPNTTTKTTSHSPKHCSVSSSYSTLVIFHLLSPKSSDSVGNTGPFSIRSATLESED